MKDQLACPYTRFHVNFFGDMMYEKLSVPQILLISKFNRILSQVTVNLCHLLSYKLIESSRSLTFHKGVKAFLVESVYPPFYCFGVLANYASCVISIHSLADEKDAVQPVFVP